MKKYLLMAAAATMMLASCGSSDNNYAGKVEYYPVQLEKNSHWSMIGPDGELLYEDEFKNRPTAVVDGMFSVLEGDGYTLYAAESKPKAILENLKGVGCVSEGLIGVVPAGERIQFVDKKGNTKFTLNPVDKKEISSCAAIFTDGMLMICNEDGKYGAVDTKGNVVIKPHYDDMGLFNEGVTIACIKNDDGERSYRIIDKKGTEIAKIKKGIEPEYYIFEYDRLPAIQGDDDDARYGFINKKGEFTKLPEKVRGIKDYNDKYIIFRDAEYNQGVMTYDGEVIIRAKYDNISFIDGGSKFLVEHDDKYDILDSKGEKIQSLEYDAVKDLDGKGFNFVAKDGSTFMLLDKEGKQIGKSDFVDINTNFLISFILSSDYYPTQNVVNQIADVITTNSIDDYKLGTRAENVMRHKSASDCTYRSTEYVDTDIFDSKYFEAEIVLDFNQAMAYSRYEPGYYSYYYSYGGSYSYYWNEDSRLETIKLLIRTTNADWKTFSKAMAKALENKGFRVSESEDNSYILLKSDVSSLLIEKDTSTSYTIKLSSSSLEYDEAPAYYDDYSYGDSCAVEEVEEAVEW